MTEKEVLTLSIEVWTYLRDHPEIKDKSHLPGPLFERVSPLLNECPLCELYCKEEGGWHAHCTGCPLAEENEGRARRDGTYCHAAFYQWAHARCGDTRAQAAARIVEILEAAA